MSFLVSVFLKNKKKGMKDQTTRIHYLKPEVMSNTLAGHRLLPNTQANF
jgi:hypothetical protein